MRARGLITTCIVALAAFGLAFPAAAAEPGEMQIRFGLLYATPTDDLAEAGQTTELDEALGFQFSYEYRVTDRIGIEPGIEFATHDVELEESGLPDLDVGEVDWRALTFSANFHLLRDRSFDFYIGPTLGYVFWGDLKTEPGVSPVDFSTDGELAYGVNSGIDVPFGDSPWAFSGGLSYLFTELTLDGSSSDIGVDPLRLRAGVTFKF